MTTEIITEDDGRFEAMLADLNAKVAAGELVKVGDGMFVTPKQLAELKAWNTEESRLKGAKIREEMARLGVAATWMVPAL